MVKRIEGKVKLSAKKRQMATFLNIYLYKEEFYLYFLQLFLLTLLCIGPLLVFELLNLCHNISEFLINIAHFFFFSAYVRLLQSVKREWPTDSKFKMGSGMSSATSRKWSEGAKRKNPPSAESSRVLFLLYLIHRTWNVVVEHVDTKSARWVLVLFGYIIPVVGKVF